MRSLAFFAIGLVVGIGVIIACSTESPPDADAAAACDCPAAESPLTDRLVRYTFTQTIPPGTLAGPVGANCNAGDLAVHGNCAASVFNGTMSLVNSGSYNGIQWDCIYRNEDVNPHDATATVLCLIPLECGNGVFDEFEQCDDHNTVDGDGCGHGCRVEEGWMCNADNDPICTRQ